MSDERKQWIKFIFILFKILTFCPFEPIKIQIPQAAQNAVMHSITQLPTIKSIFLVICQSSKYIQIQKKSSGWSAHQNSNDRSFSEMQSHGVTNFINKVDLLFYRRDLDPSLFGSIRVNSDSRGRSIVSFVFFPLWNLFFSGSWRQFND